MTPPPPPPPPPRGNSGGSTTSSSSDAGWQNASSNKRNKRKSGSHTAASAAATAATLSTSPTSPVAPQQNGSPTLSPESTNETEKTDHVEEKQEEADGEADDGEWAIGQWIRLELAVSVQKLVGGANGLAVAAANGSTGNGAAARSASPQAKIVEGRIFAYDKANGFVVLQCVSNDIPNAATKKYDLRIINTCAIASVTALSSSSVASTMDLIPVSAINWETSAHREAANIRIMETKLAKIGVGVGRDAQDLFDALSKTMECRWAESSIVVMDRVIISPPYRPENCKSNDQSALQRIKLVVQGERRKLKLDD